LLELDGTPNNKLGANPAGRVVGGRRRGRLVQLPLFRYLAASRPRAAVPLMNVINGGKHADNTIDFQGL